MKTRILHLSDLHVNEAELPYLETVAKAFLDDLTKQMSKGLRPHLVCITGDIINQGQNHEEEFKLAHELFLQPLAKLLETTPGEFFYVPGNHEVDWSKTSESFEKGLASTLGDEYALSAFQKSFSNGSAEAEYLKQKIGGYEKHIRSGISDHVIESNYFYTVSKVKLSTGVNVGVVCLNSAWRSSRFGSDDRRLLIGESLVLEAYRKISHCELKVCMCHHPFEMLAEWDRNATSRKVIKHFDVLLNGHVHESFGMLGHTVLGNLFVSTAGSLRPRDQFSSYSILEVKNDRSGFDCYYRKWYGEMREEFGADESRCEGGHFSFSRGNESQGDTSLTLLTDCSSEYRASLHLSGKENDLVCPIEEIEAVSLQSVFIEPLIYDSQMVQRNIEGRKSLKLSDLISSGENLVFYGRPEYGKTTLLRYVQEHILANYHEFGDLVPVTLRFTDVSPKNTEQIFRALAKGVEGATEKKLKLLAEAGKLVLLIDDYDDRDDTLRSKKAAVLRAFYSKYKKCRYVVTATETIGPKAKFELLSASSDFQAKACYIDSLNTARIRQLIAKWAEYHPCDVDTVLKHVLYYLEHLQLPATPLATTLFIGVLFRKKRDKNIRNEAYLIENYFETLLEKLRPSAHDGLLEFRDKEDFLAHIALQMVHKQQFEWEINDFERCKLDYFEEHDETVPDPRFFETFFRKGILSRAQGVVSFRRRSWFNFFLAKALEGNPDAEKEILESSHAVRFGKALAYKAGLKRNDVELLKWVDAKAQHLVAPLIQKYSESELRSKELHSPIHDIAETIAKDIQEKNTSEHVDQSRDEIYLRNESTASPSSPAEDVVDDFAEWITIQSDIIRNSTKIKTHLKRGYLLNNVRSYISLMWATFETLREFYRELSEEDLINLFFKGKDDATTKQKLRYVVDYTKRILHSFVPLSLILYMSDHLGNPKMLKSYQGLFDNSESDTERLFLACLAFGQDPAAGLKMFQRLVSQDSSPTEDFLLCGFVTCYCRENVIPDQLLKKIVAFIDWVRIKHSKKTKANEQVGYLKDDFRTSLITQLKNAPRRPDPGT